VTAFDAADAPALAALYDAEPVRILRSAGDWKALLAASVLVAWPARIWVVRRAGRITAYLAVQQRGPSPRQGRVMEHAGDRDAVLAAAPQVSDAVVAPARDVELAHQARARGWSPSPLPLAMAARWLAPRPEPLPLPWYGLGYV
jgi:hypothetical protein